MSPNHAFRVHPNGTITDPVTDAGAGYIVVREDDWTHLLERVAHKPTMPDTLAEAVSDSLAATTMGTDWAEAPEPSDEPGSEYVLRLTNELASRGVAHIDALTAAVEGLPYDDDYIERAAVLAILRGES